MLLEVKRFHLEGKYILRRRAKLIGVQWKQPSVKAQNREQKKQYVRKDAMFLFFRSAVGTTKTIANLDFQHIAFLLNK